MHESVKNAELKVQSLFFGATDMFTGRGGTNGGEKDDGTGEKCLSNVYCPPVSSILLWHGQESYAESCMG